MNKLYKQYSVPNTSDNEKSASLTNELSFIQNLMQTSQYKESSIIEDLHGYFEMRQLYNSAIKEINTKLEILNDEFHVRYDRNPIHHIESRLKSPESILNKVKRYGTDLNIHSIKENITDFAGIRVICCYIDDIYRIRDMLLHHSDITLISEKDYIKNPKPSGYRSLHLVIKIPIFLSDSVELVPAEIQIRTIAMDLWASLEHQLRYKKIEEVPVGIDEELLQCANEISKIDEKMQDIYKRI